MLLLACLKKRWSSEKVLVLNARKKEQMELLVFFIQSIQRKMNNKIKCIFSII